MSSAKAAALAADTGAVLNFETGWQETPSGFIRQGEQLTVNYDPQRLPACRGTYNGMAGWDLVANARFFPSGETISHSLIDHSVPGPPRIVPLILTVPADSTGAELWFQNTNAWGCSAFDSRFGSNYQFSIDQAGPAKPVMYRCGAERSLEMVNVFAQKITKIKHSFGKIPSAGNQLETYVDLTAWVRNIAYAKNVWVDLHVFDGDGNRVNADTLTLKYSGSASGNGDFFSLNQMIFLGSGGVPGNIWPRADARTVQYRLYYEVNGCVFTDGILHQVPLPADADVSQSAIATAA